MSRISVKLHRISFICYCYVWVGGSQIPDTVSFHNFKSQNFKPSVSNPKNKHVAYVSVLSHISNCQGLGRKNKFEILKTYRIYQYSLSTYVYIY